MRFSSRVFWYLLRETIPYIFFTLLILTTLIFAQQLAKQNELFFGNNASVYLSVQIILFILPNVLVITLPFSLLIGVLMALNRLSSDNEIIASRASGISLAGITAPFIVLGLLGCIISGYLTLYALPSIARQSKSLKAKLVLLALTAPLKPQTFNTYFPDHLLFINNIDDATGDWLGVFIVRKGKNAEALVLTAERGKIRLTQTTPLAIEVNLDSGLAINSNSDHPEKQIVARFAQQQIRLSAANTGLSGSLDQLPGTQESSLRELLSKARSVETPIEQRQAYVEYHKRFSLPVACIILVIIALPFGITPTARRGGRAIAFALGFILAIVYYLVLVAGQNLAFSGVLPPWLGVWLPNIIALLAAVGVKLAPPSLSIRAKKRNSSSSPPLLSKNKQTLSRGIGTARFTLSSLLNYLLLGEFLKFFLLTVFILVFSSLIFTLFDLIPSLSRSKLGWGYAITYLLYLTPQIAYYITPFALMLGYISFHGIFHKTNQLTAILASGKSFLSIVTPIFFVSTLAITMLYLLSEKVLPISNFKQDHMYNQIKGRKQEQFTTALGMHWAKSADGSIYGFQYDTPSKRLLKANVYKLNQNRIGLEEWIYAENAAMENANEWRAQIGWSYSVQPDLSISYQNFNKSSTASIVVPEGQVLFNRVVNESAKMSFLALKKYITYLSDLGASTSSLRVDLEKKLSFPFSALTLLFIAIAISRRSPARGNLAGIGISIIIGFTFWISSSLFEALARQELLPAGLAVWIPQALFTAIALLITFMKK